MLRDRGPSKSDNPQTLRPNVGPEVISGIGGPFKHNPLGSPVSGSNPDPNAGPENCTTELFGEFTFGG